MVVGFLCMDHLGIVNAITYATLSPSEQVICFDTRLDLLDALSKDSFPIYEPQLSERFAACPNIVFINDATVLNKCSTVFVTVDVDSHKSLDKFQSYFDIAVSLAFVKQIIVISQLPVGTMEKLARLHPLSSLYYMVDTLVFGSAFNNSHNSGYAFIGRRFGDYTRIKWPGHSSYYLSYNEAELLKISINCYLASQIATTDTLVDFCESKEINWYNIQIALQMDARIGSYVNPSVGIGGQHLLRDVKTMAEKSNLMRAVIERNQKSSSWVPNTVRKAIKKHEDDFNGNSIVLYGLSYKEGTNDTRDSVAELLFSELPEYTYYTHDPVVSADNPFFDNERIKYCNYFPIDKSPIIVIGCPWTDYQYQYKMMVEKALSFFPSITLIDPYALFATETKHPNINHITRGQRCLT